MQAAEEEREQRGLVLDMPADEPNRNSATASLHERNLRHGLRPAVLVLSHFLQTLLCLPRHWRAYLPTSACCYNQKRQRPQHVKGIQHACYATICTIF